MQCPNCGNYVEGKKIKSYSNKVARQGAKSLVHGATSVGGTTTGATIGTAILPGIGTILGAAAGFIGSAMFNQKVNESIDKAGDYIEDEFADIEYEYMCPKCGKRWTSNQNVSYISSDNPSDPEIGQFVLMTGKKLIGNPHIQLSNNFSQVMGIALKERFFSIIESHFGITIPDDVRNSLKTYDNVSDYLIKEIATKASLSNAAKTKIEQYVLTAGVNAVGNSYLKLSNQIIISGRDIYPLIESRFGVTIPYDTRNCLKTYQNVADYLIKGGVDKTKLISNTAYDKQVEQYVQIIGAKVLDDSNIQLSDDLSQVMGQPAKEKFFSIIESDLGYRIPIIIIDSFKTYQDVADYLSFVFPTKIEYNPELDSNTNTASTTNQEPLNSKSELDYVEALKEFLEDDEISDRERRMLERIRQSLGISEQRAAELEASLKIPKLTEDEQEYLDMYREYVEEGEITEKERKRLDRFASALGISPERMKELETM